MRDEWRHLDPSALDELEGTHIDRGASVRLESTGCAGRGHQPRLPELEQVQHAGVDSVVAVAVEQYRGLLANQARQSGERRT